ncbi:MAG: hypothetical protein KDC87_09415 [Planctomycetes bacterium]|nr:hypothetical protein [Planctomycetota bacterium]MCB9869550.1 hypothetical protein [Planctomycetota bacterium]MCB9889937.1 hypothetical protein [Planctomycetota bacterium]
MLLQHSAEWADQSIFHPVSLAAVLCLGLATLVVDRARALLPMIVITCFITVAQRVVVGGFDFTVMRLMLFFGWTRVLVRGELGAFRWRGLDTAVVLWAAATCVGYVAMHAQHGTAGSAVTNRLGWLMDNVGIYFLFRVLLRDWEDVVRFTRWLALLAVPLLFFFAFERVTHTNLFGFLGGVLKQAWIREGRIRCQGSFSHPILAGCFWSGVLPLLVALIRTPRLRGRGVAIVGALAATAIILHTASSTPIMAIVFTAMGTMMYPLRGYMRYLRWALVIGPVLLHMVMKKPVWHLIARVNVVGGSTGWHRFHLIDQCIRHFSDWWLCGVLETGYWGRGLDDVTNFFVLQAASAGLFCLLGFVLVLVFAFRSVSRIMRGTDHLLTYMLAWQLGVCLFVHCMNFIAVSYAHKPLVLFYLTLAALASIESGVSVRQERQIWQARNAALRARVLGESDGPEREAAAAERSGVGSR